MSSRITTGPGKAKENATLQRSFDASSDRLAALLDALRVEIQAITDRLDATVQAHEGVQTDLLRQLGHQERHLQKVTASLEIGLMAFERAEQRLTRRGRRMWQGVVFCVVLCVGLVMGSVYWVKQASVQVDRLGHKAKAIQTRLGHLPQFLWTKGGLTVEVEPGALLRVHGDGDAKGPGGTEHGDVTVVD